MFVCVCVFVCVFVRWCVRDGVCESVSTIVCEIENSTALSNTYRQVTAPSSLWSKWHHTAAMHCATQTYCTYITTRRQRNTIVVARQYNNIHIFCVECSCIEELKS